MDAKQKSAISRIQQDRSRGNPARAAKRAADALKKFPDSAELYTEAIEATLEAGESLEAIGLLKRGLRALPDNDPGLVQAASERAAALGDAVMAKFLIEDSVRRRRFQDARRVIGLFPDRVVRDLLQRTRMKHNSLASAAHGGHDVDGELMTNIVSEAVLCSRLGRIDEAIQAAERALTADRDHCDALVPFLEEIVADHPPSAPIRIGLARCLHAASRHNAAVDQLVEAVRLDPEAGADALDLVREIGGAHDELPEPTERALIQMLLITGDHEGAAGHLRSRFSDQPHDIVDIAASHARDARPMNDLHTVVLDAAADSGRDGPLHGILTALESVPENHPRLLEWFDAKEADFPEPVALIYAQLLADAGRHEDAAAALKTLCVTARSSHPAVAAFLSGRRGEHDALDALLSDIEAAGEETTEAAPSVTAPQTAPAAEPAAGEADGGIEVFETSGFEFGSAVETAAPAIEKEPAPDDTVTDGDGTDGDSDFDIYDGTGILGGESAAKAAAPVASDYSGSRRPLDTDHAGIIWDEEGDDDTDSTAEAGEPSAPPEAPEPTPETPVTAEPEAITKEPESGPEPPVGDPSPVTEARVHNVADALYASGAATFFHIDDGSPETPETPEAPPVVEQDNIVASHEDTPETAVSAGEPEGNEHAGEGDREEEERDEVALAFDEIESELTRGRPARALEQLQALAEDELTEEQRKKVWLETAACQRTMQDIDAARATLDRLVERYPDCPEVDRLAKLNYRDYLELQCADATALEKITSLEDDDV